MPGLLPIHTSLTKKLVLALSLLVLLGSAIFWYLQIKAEKSGAMRNLLAVASSFTDIVNSSLHHDMLAVRGADIQLTVEAIGGSESIDKISIFGCKGVISYSSEPGEVGSVVQWGSESCHGCHRDPLRPRETLIETSRWTIYHGGDEQRMLAYVEPIYNKPDCFTAACHAHPAEQRVLGLLMTDISLAPLDNHLRNHVIGISLYLLLSVLVLGTVLSLILWKLILRPISELAAGMEQISAGNTTYRVQVHADDEIGRLAATFNTMVREVGAAREKMENWTGALEEEVRKKTTEITQAQNKLIQAEKMAALGRLTADVAHEIRNPLTALGGFARRLQNVVTTEQQKKYTSILVKEVDRLELILRDTLIFSREARLHFEVDHLEETVHKSLNLYEEICRTQKIEVVTKLQAFLPARLDPEQIRQVVNNLITNAIDAMPGGGTLTLETAVEVYEGVSCLVLRVEDTGSGVPEDKLALIFEPFYTTKKIGHGTGLGLSIARKIMEEHSGFIKAENCRGRHGLRISLYFPYQPEEEKGKKQCWEVMQCQRDSNNVDRCPAYPDFGRSCWVIAGTCCHGKVQGTFAQKMETCTDCRFYHQVRGEAAQEGEHGLV